MHIATHEKCFLNGFQLSYFYCNQLFFNKHSQAVRDHHLAYHLCQLRGTGYLPAHA